MPSRHEPERDVLPPVASLSHEPEPFCHPDPSWQWWLLERREQHTDADAEANANANANAQADPEARTQAGDHAPELRAGLERRIGWVG